MSEALENLPKGKLVTALKHTRNVALKARDVTEKAVGTALIGAGGALGGVLTAKYPSIRGTAADGSLLGAAAALFAGFTGMAGKNSEQAIELGRGMLAGGVAIRAHRAWLAKMAKEPKK